MAKKNRSYNGKEEQIIWQRRTDHIMAKKNRSYNGKEEQII
jgi:hypothetical protein